DIARDVLKGKINAITYLPNGSASEVWRLSFEDQRCFIIKNAKVAHLAIEQKTLAYLKQYSFLPLPSIYFYQDDLLILDDLGRHHPLNQQGENQAGDLIAGLHSIQHHDYGFKWDTMIGCLLQPNGSFDHWVNFFIQQRLYFMADLAYRKSQISTSVRLKIDRLATKLDRWLVCDRGPCLLHGDLWTGNIIGGEHYVKAFIDPAVYFGEPEFDLAYALFFNSFSNHFLDRYSEHFPISSDFHEARKSLYQLYPLLMHAYLYGGRYQAQIEDILKRFVD
ncbi:MAG: fructosamine kinase family protein, partial [Pseudomonadota bacterium]